MNKINILIATFLYFLGGPTLAVPVFPTVLEGATESVDVRLAQASEIELDKGQKWPVDRVMMVQFRQLEKELNTFRESGPQSYQRLGQSLETKLAKLVSSCTMQGQAHDELHKWLVPFMDDVDAFQEESDAAALPKRLLDLRGSFDVFNAHFR